MENMERFTHAITCFKEKRYQEALDVFVTFQPSFDICKNIGLCHLNLNNIEHTRTHFEHALRFKFDLTVASALMVQYYNTKQYHVMYGWAQTILFLYPRHKLTNSYIADLFCITGRHACAMKMYEQIHHYDPTLSYYINDTMDTVKKVKPPLQTHICSKSPRIIRIGYIGDVYTNPYHPVYSFVNTIIANHDTLLFTVFHYQLKQDEDIDECIDNIKKDTLDIVIDTLHPLSKWTSIYMHNLATRVVSYGAYPGTSNDKHIHYKILDTVVFESYMDQCYTENILCMDNGFHVYKPTHTFPEWKRIERDSFHMCCFNNPIKITPCMIRLWKKLLTIIPNSRLYLGYHYYSSEFIQSKWKNEFDGYNISFVYEENIEHMLQHYNIMDVALDTYPYNGTTITCEALSMNVPVVTLKGKYPHSRIGASILETVQCMGLIADTEETYISAVMSVRENATPFKETLKHNLHQLTDIDGFMKRYEYLLCNL